MSNRPPDIGRDFRFVASLDALPPGVAAAPVTDRDDPHRVLMGLIGATSAGPATLRLWGLAPLETGGFIGRYRVASRGVPTRSTRLGAVDEAQGRGITPSV